jgi:hypothetical protein
METPEEHADVSIVFWAIVGGNGDGEALAVLAV